MPTPTQYVNDLTETMSVIGGNTAPQTGQYYSHIYSQDDPGTGVPTIGVSLHKQETVTHAAPVQLNNLTDQQILQMVRSGKQLDQTTNNTQQNIHTLNVSRNATIPTNINKEIQKQKDTIVLEDGGGLPIAGMFTLGLLLSLVGFVYFIIRMWQDHQAQKLVMMNIKSSTSITKQTNNQPKATMPTAPAKQITTEQQSVTTSTNTNNKQQADDWRSNIIKADKMLESLLEKKGISGETVADKLKAIKPGQFALADMAWEAQQGAKKLLTAHDTTIDPKAIKRVLQLFKQVFAEHGIV